MLYQLSYFRRFFPFILKTSAKVMKSFKKEKTKPLKKYSILATAAEIMYILLS